MKNLCSFSSSLSILIFLIVTSASFTNQFTYECPTSVPYTYNDYLNLTNNLGHFPTVVMINATFHTASKFCYKPSPFRINETGETFSNTIPQSFQTVRFICLATYPTVWKFKKPPHEDDLLKDFHVAKRRIIGEDQFEIKSSYIYESNLTLNFKNPRKIPEIFCTQRKNLSRTTSIESVPTKQDQFTLGILISSNDTIPEYEERRFGKNTDCNVTMILDVTQKGFLCGSSSGGKTRPQIIPCGNPDECNSIFVLDDKNSTKPYCNETFYMNCTGVNCTKFSVSNSPAVVICEDVPSTSTEDSCLINHKHSIARRYMVVLENGNESRLRLGRDEFDEDTIALKREGDDNDNDGDIYFGENVTFICQGLGSHYTYGFQWTIEDEGDQKHYLGLGEERYEDNIYIIKKTIHFTTSFTRNLNIFCHGPYWNFETWINASMSITLHEPVAPQIKYLQRENFTNATSSQYEVVCIASGLPIPQIGWVMRVNGEVHHDTNTTKNTTLVQIATTNITTEMEKRTKSRFILKHINSQDEYSFTCHAENYVDSTNKTHDKPRLGKVNLWLIIGSLFAALVLVVIFGFLIIRNHYVKRLQLLSYEEIQEFQYGDANAGDNALILPYSIENEIPQDSFSIESNVVLGEGSYGVVLKGKFRSRPVAIKTMKKSAEIKYFKALLDEIKILSYVGTHENLVNFIGANTKKIKKKEVYLLMEFCEQGSLLKFLRKSRGFCIDLFNLDSSEKACMRQNSKKWKETLKNESLADLPYITTNHLLHWVYDIASGMEFLSSKKVIHGDLAARNVLLTDDLIAKVGDFGLSKQLYEYSIYVQKLECPLPLKWMAIESLQDLEFSVSSDVWSFGITLWEIFSLGQPPYPGIPQWTFQSYTLLKNGHRMQRPQFSNDEIYEIMRECWKEEPNERPDFEYLKGRFKDLCAQVLY